MVCRAQRLIQASVRVLAVVDVAAFQWQIVGFGEPIPLPGNQTPESGKVTHDGDEQ